MNTRTCKLYFQWNFNSKRARLYFNFLLNCLKRNVITFLFSLWIFHRLINCVYIKRSVQVPVQSVFLGGSNKKSNRYWNEAGILRDIKDVGGFITICFSIHSQPSWFLEVNKKKCYEKKFVKLILSLKWEIGMQKDNFWDIRSVTFITYLHVQEVKAQHRGAQWK